MPRTRRPYSAEFRRRLVELVRGGQAPEELARKCERRRCAATGERTLPVLEAAHVRPYAEGGRHELSNGILLRSDLHTLFDSGYLTITPNYHIEVSRRIRDEFENGRETMRCTDGT